MTEWMTDFCGLVVAIFNAGEAVLIGGTSASAPTFSAILTRINEERLQAGKSTVGFVNPILVCPKRSTLACIVLRDT